MEKKLNIDLQWNDGNCIVSSGTIPPLMFKHTGITKAMKDDIIVRYNPTKGWVLSVPPKKLVIVDVDGTLTDGRVLYDGYGNRSRLFSVIDGYGFELLRKHGFGILVLSGEGDACISERMQKLNVDHALGVKDKAEYVEKWYQGRDEIYVIGDDVNDLGLMRMDNTVLAATPNESILSQMELDITVLTRRGGKGAFREFAEMVLLSNGITP
jgi:3-deoxy-D-manno-octulosonate 8-phosphate phosphatase (KDO 8-P phosphatase)